MVTTRFIVMGVVVAQLADAATFTIGVARVGIDLEANAFAVELYSTAGMSGVLIAKLMVIIAAIGVLAWASGRFPLLRFLGGATATNLGLLGFVANTVTVLSVA